MDNLKSLAGFMFGDVAGDQGFWYSHLLWEIDGLMDEQLYWTPAPNSLCMLWHVGHIAHRERTHIGLFLQGMPEPVIPAHLDVFGPEWASVEQIQGAVSSVAEVLDWVHATRQISRQYIESLHEEDLLTVPFTSEGGLTIAHWLFITACHASLHIGRIQLLRAMLENKPERVC